LKAGAVGSGVLRPSTVTLAMSLFLRAVGIYCILLGLSYWMRLIGLYEGELWRYDLMPLYWRVAAVSLAILFPIAGAGLWMTASWGPVIWFICAASEVVMYIAFPEIFGWEPSVLIFHGLFAVIYLGFRVVIYLQNREQA